MANGNDTATGWMSDVQRNIAMILVGTFAAVTLFATAVSTLWPEATALSDMAKTLQAALVNMSLIALGFFFGSNMAKQAADVRQQDIIEKMTPTALGTPPPPPTPTQPQPPVVWWGKLTEPEKTGIVASPDARVQLIAAAMTAGNATPDDLAYLVTNNLLTQIRADEIQKV